jgi:Na+-transporting NADH:ubiquinone oxidoreductase subunit E
MSGWSAIGPLAVFIGAIFTNNILLTNYLGMCSFLSISREVKSSIGLGAAVIFVMGMTNALNWPIHYYILVPLDITYLGYIVYIVVIAASVQLVEMIVERVSEPLYRSLGIFLPLITVNCAVFGAVLFMLIRRYSFIASFTYGVGAGIGWALAIVAMAGIRQKMVRAKLPRGLEGAGIALIIAGIMALAFMGFSGMIPAS